MKAVRFSQFGGRRSSRSWISLIRIRVPARSGLRLTGGAGHVVTVADFGGAQEHGVRFSSGDTGRAVPALGEMIESGRYSLPVAQTFPLAEVAEAHRVSEQGQMRGKLVLLVG